METEANKPVDAPKQSFLANKTVRLVLLGVLILVVAYMLYSMW